MPIKLSIKEALTRPNTVFIDTRTPKEFEEDHLPSAINVPILTNEERAIVGTLYKQVSKEKAIEQGMQFFSPKLPTFLEQFNKHKDKEIIVYCWRGGMRSATVVALFEALGYNIKQLTGGYKAYRAHVSQELSQIKITPKVFVLWGLTCTCKTELLKTFPQFLNLEELAQHRSSLYGSIGLEPRTQKTFENLLLQRLQKLQSEPFILIEGESRKIGNIEIPSCVWKAMNNATPLLAQKSLDLRAQACVKEYFNTQQNIEQVYQITQKLWKVISKKHKEETLRAIENKEYHKAAKILLEFYYDPLYGHTLTKIPFAAAIDTDDLNKAREELYTQIHKNL